MKQSPAACVRRRLRCEFLEQRIALAAGPYSPAAGQPGAAAIAMDDEQIVAWASAFEDYHAGQNVDPAWQTPERALGPAVGDSFDVVSLGNGGRITLLFAEPIRNGRGADFAVFENSVSDTFLELAFVEVSSDGVHFFRMPNDSLTAGPVGAFGSVDPTQIDGFAGKHRQGFGTPFDLEALAGVSPLLNVRRVSHVRLVDIVGDGSALDSSGDPIYDPHPTSGSGGFDLDAVAVLHRITYEERLAGFEDVGAALAAESHWSGPDPSGEQQPGGFGDTIVVGGFTSNDLRFNNVYSLDYGSWSGWAYSNETDVTTPDFSNQFSALAGGGAAGSRTFAVAYQDLYGVYPPPTLSLLPAVQDWFVRSIRVTNTAYAGLSMRDGDAFAKKFGGATGDDPDWFLLTIEGKDEGGGSVGEVDFYLADFRFEDNSQDYIVQDWVEVDLSSLQGAASYQFTLSSSDNGDFGMNTPAFFALDHIVLGRERLPIEVYPAEISEADGPAAATGRVGRNDGDLSSPLVVSLASSDSSEASVPPTVTIPAGADYAEFAVGAVDDSLADGDQNVAILASAPGYGPGSASLQVSDDDPRALTLTLSQQSVAESAGPAAARGVVRRNDSDLSGPLSVSLASSDTGEAQAPLMVTIAAGSAEVAFDIEAIDDAAVDGAQIVEFTASANGYIDGAAALEVLDDEIRRLSLSLDRSSLSETSAPPTARMEDVGLSLAAESYWNGADSTGGFVSDGLAFNNHYDAVYGVWAGWAYSNTTDSTTAGYANQFSAFPGGGALGSATYAVAYAYPGGIPAEIRRTPQSQDSTFRSLRVANTTYAARTMLEGDAFSKKFGGPTGNDPDWFLLTVEGRDADGALLGTIDVYLADYRFVDNSQDYVLADWMEVDLASLAQAESLSFVLSSSDTGAFGMNTPAYFALDQIVMDDGRQAGAIAEVRRNDASLSSELVVEIVNALPFQLWAPQTVTIPAGAASVSFRIEALDDNLLDGDLQVGLTATAAGYESAQATVAVLDHETVAVGLLRDSIEENAGQWSGGLILRRSNSDRSEALSVAVSSSDPSAARVSASLVIPAGASSAAFPIEVINDLLLDGAQYAVFTPSADGYSPVSATLQVLDNDRLGHNVDNPNDVNADGAVGNQDVMLLLEAVRESDGGGPLFRLGFDLANPLRHLDVNDDGYFSNLDVLLTISAVRTARQQAGKMGDSPSSQTVGKASPTPALADAAIQSWATDGTIAAPRIGQPESRPIPWFESHAESQYAFKRRRKG